MTMLQKYEQHLESLQKPSSVLLDSSGHLA
jgi:hypothetical protein